MPEQKPKIVGVVGSLAAGKDTVAEYIARKLQVPILQISGVLKEIAAARGIQPTRDYLIQLGREIAETKGPAYLAEVLVSRVPGCAVVAGMRQLGQIDYFRQHADLLLIAVCASSERRFQRMRGRAKPGDPQSLQEFIEIESREESAGNASVVQQVSECVKRADVIIHNEGSIEELHRNIDTVIAAYDLSYQKR